MSGRVRRGDGDVAVGARRWLGAGLAGVLVAALALPAGAQSLDDVTGAVGSGTDALPGGTPRAASALQPVFDALAGDACDPTDALRCLLPFPNDRFTAADETTPTGLRIDLPAHGMPRSILQKSVDPTEWNRNDGFSPGAMALTHVPGLDLEATFGLHELGIDWDDTGVAQIRVPSLSVAPDAPIVLLDATTGERQPYYAELDEHPATSDDERLLIVRPLTNLEHGHRYVVALRDLVDHDGQPIEATEPFATIRDGLPPTACPPARPDHAGQPGRPDHAGQPGRPGHAGPGRGVDCPGDLEGDAGRHQRMFGDLEAAGVAVADLHLAWDFTVASAENLTGRALAMRDQAFAMLGDTDLADRVVEGDAPAWRIDQVITSDDPAAVRIVRGSVTVPNFLDQPHPTISSIPGAPGGPVPPSVLPVGSRFVYDSDTPGPMDTPVVNERFPTLQAPFTCVVPAAGPDGGPAHPTLYGHGLLGTQASTESDDTRQLRLGGFMPCGTPWFGMSTGDLVNIVTIMADLSNFPTMPDRAQQGFLDFLVLGRALAHPQGLITDPAFRGDDGAPLFEPSKLVYDGNSQGGIMGAAVTALAPDFERAVLGVPGINYSTLLNRSVDWEGAYGEILYAFYDDPVDRQLIFAVMQMLWDRAEGNGYAHFVGDRTLPNTPSHQVLLHAAFSDHQVANIASEVQARTAGARLLETSLPAGRHWADQAGERTFRLPGFETVGEDGRREHRGSALVYFDAGNAMPPHGNLPPRDGSDPHSLPRRDAAGQEQKTAFFLEGVVRDVNAGAPYLVPCRGTHGHCAGG